jgi:hypothetical protein
MKRRLSAVVLLALTACSGRGALPGVPSVPPPELASDRATVDFTIAVPLRISGKRGPHYVPPSMKSARIVLGTKTVAVLNLTPVSSGCKGSPVSCSVKFSAPAGKDAFTVTLYDRTNGKGKALSKGSVVAKIVKGKTNRVKVVCGGVVASLTLDLAVTAPAPNGASQTIALALGALDADGNTIIPPGNYHNGPIVVTDSDTSHTQLQAGSGAPGSAVDVAAPGTSLAGIYDGSPALTSATLTATMPKASTVAAASAQLTPAGAAVTIDTANGGPAISKDILGVNLPVWIDDTQSFIATAYKNAGVRLVRWPGGSLADAYHYAGPSACNGEYFNPNSTFDKFMADVAGPDNLDVAITVNYGSNSACNGGGDPTEAGAWAADAANKSYSVPYWTVGNEDYGSWEYDLHTKQHDGGTYATAMTGAGGYYNQIKSNYSNAKVGVVVAGAGSYSTWDTAVLSGAAGSYDYVEFHYYAQQGSAYGQAENDSYLLTSGVDNLVSGLNAVRTEVDTYNTPGTIPIYLGELNSIVTTPGKQTVSIVNGLYLGMAMAEVMKTSGVKMATWWLGSGDCDSGAGSASVYGFQDYGSYALFSDGPGSSCPNDLPAAGTPFPDGRTFAMLAQFAGSASVMRNVSTSTPTSAARFYADTLGSGFGVLLFNLNESSSLVTAVALKNASQSNFTATQIVYGKKQYDDSASGTWTGPVTTSLGTVGTTFNVTLPPWSMSLVTLTP